MTYSDEFNSLTKIADEKKRAQDLEDLNLERSGANVGRIQRFLVGANAPNLLQAKKDREAQQLQTLLDIMMLDQEYAALWQKVGDDARKTQNEIEDFQKELRERIAQTDTAIAQMLDDAVTLPDGRKAFMNKEGKAFTADGDAVDPDVAAGINWQDTTPYEEFLALQDYRNRLNDANHRTQAMEVQIGDILDRHNDESDPPTKSQLGDDQDGIEAIRKEVQEMQSDLDLKPAAELPVQKFESTAALPVIQ